MQEVAALALMRELCDEALLDARTAEVNTARLSQKCDDERRVGTPLGDCNGRGPEAAQQPGSKGTGAVPTVDAERCTGTVHPVAPDGNCMFSVALSELVRLEATSVATSVADLRHVLLLWVESNGEAVCSDLTVSQWIEFETDETLAQYVRRMRMPSQWGGVVELYALTQVYGVTARA